MADATLPGLFGTGDHASRPSASTPGKGGLYACSTHNLIYQTDGSSWTTWATLSSGGSTLTTKGDLLSYGSGLDRLAVGTNGYVLTADSGETLGIKWAAASGGGGGAPTGVRYPVQVKNTTTGTATTAATTMPSTPTNGNYMICLSVSEGTTNISSISQTNVSWSKLAESTASTAAHVEVWIGVISGSAGTSVTVNYSGSAFCGACFSEWSGLAGTLDQSAVVTNVGPRRVPIITPTDASALVVTVAGTAGFLTNFTGFTSNHLTLFSNCAEGSFGGAVGYAVAFGFPGLNPVYGTWFNTATGANMSAVTVSII